MLSRRENSRRAPGRLGAAGWMLAAGALLLLFVLWQWSDRLAPDRPGAARAAPRAEPLPDGEEVWGEPRPVTFPGENCRPWHISAVADLPPPPPDPLLVTSRLADPYGLIAAGFSQECGRPRVTVVLEHVGGDLEKPLPSGPAAAVGTAAVEWYQRRHPERALVFAAVPNPGARGWGRAPWAGISPWVPAEALLGHLLKILPRRARLGLLTAERAGDAMTDALLQAGQRAGRPLMLYRYRNDETLRKSLQQAAAETGAWVVVWDASAAFEEEFQLILNAAEKASLPLAVTDEEHVRRGALVGAGPDSFRVGQQLCRLLRAQQAGRLPDEQRVFCPEYSFGVLHLARAEKLGYVFDAASHPQIKVYKWH